MSKEDCELVWGASAIGATIGKEERPAFHMLKRGYLPARKVGEQWVARRDELLNPALWPKGKKAGA